MKVIEYITEPFESAVVTIGNFDGVHIGHQALLLRTVKKAKKMKGTAIAITFKPHPTQIFKQNSPTKLITSYQHKNELISKLGIDVLISLPFTKKFASMSAVNFLVEILVKRIGMKAIVVGKDYSFGKNRIGSANTLKKYSNKLNFEVIVEQWVKSPEITNNRISSTKIRNMIMEGRIESASKILGRNYSMQGKVIHGKNRGKKLLGFPTANISPDNDLYPKVGVYAVIIKLKNQLFKGVANIGKNPTFNNSLLSMEVHILDFEKNIYNRNIQIIFFKRLRPETRFSSAIKLADQIRKDVDKADKILTRILKNKLSNSVT